VTKLRVKWIKSDIGYARDQRQTLKALGLHRLNDTVEHKDTPPVRGMIVKIKHLVKVEVIKDAAA